VLRRKGTKEVKEREEKKEMKVEEGFIE